MNRELKKEQTRIRIQDAAYSLFSEQGYEHTTIEQVARLAGVAKGTFFNYFASKEDLIHELQGVFVMTEIAKLKAKPGPLIPRLRMLIFQMVQQFPLNKSLTRAMFQADLAGGAALVKHNCMVEEMLEVIVPTIVLGQESGELRQDMPAAMMGRLALQTYFGTLVMWSMSDDDEPIDEQMALTFDLFFKGIAG
ncbi:TetR/AcrR family transcriptional regulator [Paenibacillus sepulcri]|uniref:TetR/AcrR family transcriptional regulator n=1 Tax=Paenibacillus sepulcri TaxID=359917 RepID=A0ABS7C7N5_9BACL|nr:TetR/AcrR family transcriptional regulator [Paenibacillus sepulcri]